MADQPASPGFDPRKVIEQSAAKSTLQELARKGIHRVKVLDEAAINQLIQNAVRQALGSKSDVVSDGDREKMVAASRQELDKLVKEFQQHKDKADLVARDKETLASEVENLQKQLQIQRQLADTLGKQRYDDGREAAKREIDELKAKLAKAEEGARAGGEDAVKAAVSKREAELRQRFSEYEKELKAEAQRKYDEGAASQKGVIEQLRLQAGDAARQGAQQKENELNQRLMGEMQKNVELSERLAKTLEDMRSRDDEVAKKMEQLFTKSIEGLSKKLGDLKFVSGPGGGGGGGGSSTDYSFRQSEDVLKHMLSSELESNVKNMEKSEGKVAGKINNALERLKAMRGGGPAKAPEEKKDDKK